MPISQQRMIGLVHSAKFFLDKIKLIRSEAQMALQRNYNNELARLILEIINDGDIFSASATIENEANTFNPQRLKANQKAAERQARWRDKQPRAPIAYNALTNEVTGDIGEMAKQFLESSGVKVKDNKPDEYDALAKQYNQTDPAFHGFKDDLRNVPKSEDDLFREPGENETDTE